MTIETPQQAAQRLSAGVIAKGFAFVGLHEYQGAGSESLYWLIRCKHPTTGERWIRPMHRDDSGYKLGKPKMQDKNSLYRLPELLAADPALPVWVVEGEACADALAGLDLIVTTSGSASSANAADWGPLQGRRAILWPDNDKPGTDYAEAVTKHLRALGCVIELVDVAGLRLAKHGDCVDWLNKNPKATITDLLELPRTDLTKSSGDNEGSGDTAPGLGLSCPQSSLGTGNTWDNLPEGDILISKPETAEGQLLPYFVFTTNTAGKFPSPGVYYIGVGVEGKEKDIVVHLAPQWICSPLYVAAKTRNAIQSEWGRLLVLVDSDGHLHRWAMPFELLAGSGEEVRRVLLREGVTLTTNRRLRPLLETYLQEATTSLHMRCVTRTGWHGDVFVLPRQTFRNEQAEPVFFQTANPDFVALSASGELADWRENVSVPCAGNSRLVLVVSMAFAGPCLGLVHAEGGGVNLHGPSSAGKSTALYIAASAYGPPKKYSKTWRATDNGLEGTAALHSDMLLILDEIGQLDPKHAGQIAYMLANGAGKARSDRNGVQRAVTTWRVLFLSSGEVGLDSLIKEGDGVVRAGQQVRVVDVPAEADAALGLFDIVPDGLTPGKFADDLQSAAAKYHSTALPAFLEALASNPTKYRETIRELRTDIASRLALADDPGQVRRVADRFALIAAAGELATALNLTGWSTGEAEWAATVCFKAWKDARGTAGNAEPAAMLQQVRAFLESHGESRFTHWNACRERSRTINRAGYRRDGNDGPTYYIETGAFRDEVCRGLDARAVTKVLIEAKVLDARGDRRGTRKMRLPDGRNTRMYVVLPTIWNDEQ